MKKYLLLSLVLMTSSTFANENYLSKTYITLGAGYKFQESQLYYHDDDGVSYKGYDPISARIEVGYHYSKSIKFGISHHSQWLTGFPFNNDKNEYGYLWWHKTYTIGGKEIKSIEARGAGGQYIFVIPELESVVVITSGNYRNGNSQQPEKILEEYILPAIIN